MPYFPVVSPAARQAITGEPIRHLSSRVTIRMIDAGTDEDPFNQSVLLHCYTCYIPVVLPSYHNSRLVIIL